MLELQPVSEAPLQLQILRLCDAWWKKDLKEKETFGRSAMIIALTKSLDLKKPVSIRTPWHGNTPLIKSKITQSVVELIDDIRHY